jgi:hypothetical protein
VGHARHAAQDQRSVGILLDVAHQRAVDLEHVDREAHERAERGEAGAEVVEREGDPRGLALAQLVEAVLALVHQGFGDLELEPLGGQPARINAWNTVWASRPQSICARETFTETRRSAGQDFASRQEAQSTHEPIASIKPSCSAIGMKSRGRSSPSVGCRQRTSASAPQSLPSSSATRGWRARASWPRSTALGKSRRIVAARSSGGAGRASAARVAALERALAAEHTLLARQRLDGNAVMEQLAAALAAAVLEALDRPAREHRGEPVEDLALLRRVDGAGDQLAQRGRRRVEPQHAERLRVELDRVRARVALPVADAGLRVCARLQARARLEARRRRLELAQHATGAREEEHAPLQVGDVDRLLDQVGRAGLEGALDRPEIGVPAEHEDRHGAAVRQPAHVPAHLEAADPAQPGVGQEQVGEPLGRELRERLLAGGRLDHADAHSPQRAIDRPAR